LFRFISDSVKVFVANDAQYRFRVCNLNTATLLDGTPDNVAWQQEYITSLTGLCLRYAKRGSSHGMRNELSLSNDVALDGSPWHVYCLDEEAYPRGLQASDHVRKGAL